MSNNSEAIYTDAAAKIDETIRRLFPNVRGGARSENIISRECLTVKCSPNFYREGGLPNNIAENDPGFLNFIGRYDEAKGKFTLEVLGSTRRRGIAERGTGKKYRKISAKTPEELARKFSKWLEDNADGIRVG